METIPIRKVPPGESGHVEAETPAAKAAQRIAEKRGVAPKEEPMPKGVKGSQMSEEERRAKKAEYNRAYQARRKAGGKPKAPRGRPRAEKVPGPTSSLQDALEVLLQERTNLDTLIAFLERRIAAK